MQFKMDTSGAGGANGPFLTWSARGTQCRKIPPETFYISDRETGKFQLDSIKTAGVVMDIANMKTGWSRSDGIKGQPPEWKWNPSIDRMMPKPGDDYKTGFSVRCAIGGGETAVWEQAGASAWNAFVALAPALEQGPGDGSLPLVRFTGNVRHETFGRGTASVPELVVVKWVQRPDCLKEGFAPRVDTPASQRQRAAPSAPAPAPAPAPQPEAPVKGLSEDIAF